MSDTIRRNGHSLYTGCPLPVFLFFLAFDEGNDLLNEHSQEAEQDF